MKQLSKHSILVLALVSAIGYAEETHPVFTQSGDKDPTFEELLQTHGEKQEDGSIHLSRTKPILGSTIDVDNEFLEEGLGEVSNPHDIPRLGIKYSLGNTSAKKAAKDYTRWYQLDGNTEIFRLFPGDKDGKQVKACRSEVHCGGYSTKDQIVVWEASYYVPSEYNGQRSHAGVTMQLQLPEKPQGTKYPWIKLYPNKIQHHYTHLMKPWRGKKEYVFEKNPNDKRIVQRFRYDGYYYDFSIRSPDGEFQVIDGGTLPCEAQTVGFRWGCYTGQAEAVDGMRLVFVSGAKIYTEKGSITPPAWVPKECLTRGDAAEVME